MNGKCLDIGIIQAFLDGELRSEQAVKISDHVAECDPCTMLLAQAEEENSLVFSVLDREINTLVPTQRLWSRINDSIIEEKSRTSVWQRFMSFVSASLLNPSFAAAAGILLVVGMVVVVWNSGPETSTATAGDVPPAPVGPSVPENTGSIDSAPSVDFASADDTQAVKRDNGVTQTKLSDAQLRQMVIKANYVERGPRPINVVPASAQYLPGEESYIKTISELQSTVTTQNASMNASSQVSFQRDLAMVDDAIGKMRNVVKKNPRNQAARQVLYSSYQDKIDLLKSSAGRDDLMAIVQD